MWRPRTGPGWSSCEPCAMIERCSTGCLRTLCATTVRRAMHNLGETRSRNGPDHLLQTPDTFVRTSLPVVERGTVVVHVSPAVGASFTQCTAELESGGAIVASSAQRFLYVLSGSVDVAAPTGPHALEP